MLHILIKTKLLPTKDNYNDKCPECSTIFILSNLPISSNESDTFNYTDQHGVELNLGLEYI
jgi:hypothetical protein